MEDETLILQGDKIFINTGSRPLIPEISGIIGNNKVYTSEALLELRQLPERLAIIGGGPIGLEFASIYANVGSKVTVFVNKGQVLSREDNNTDKVYQHKTDAVLIATGRKPNIEDLNIGAAGVEAGTDGAIKVDEYLKTSNKDVWTMDAGLPYTF